MLYRINKERAQGRIFPGTGLAGLWVSLLILAVTLIGFSSLPALAQDSQAKTGDDEFDYQAQTLRVGVWMDGKESGEVLQKGEKFTVGFQVNQDAYSVVYHIDTDGLVSVLWPRSRYDDGFAFGGHEYLLPVSGSRRLVASSSQGEGFVEAIVSAYPFDLRDLELDFHHETSDVPWNFQVAGDPFLAMNEVNFVVTGLEDSGDFVITNYLSYYVHQKVDHPRFLCSQCHFEDDVTYEPYNDTCTLEIKHDYGWSNNWYDNYGYYPVYANPVYVYVDPWTWRPWVNFWYDPWYTCAPSRGWGWGYHCWSWYDSPRYGGNCYSYYESGNRRYRPLDRAYATDGTRVKSREYTRVSGLVGKNGPSERDRTAIRTRTTLTDASRPTDGLASARSGDPMSRGTERTQRVRPRIETSTQLRGNTGLRIRDNSQIRLGGEQGQTPVRHTAGGGTERSALKPVQRSDSGSGSGHTAVRPAQRAVNPSRTDKPANSRVGSDQSGNGDRTIKPVEPRKKGTRVWNTRPENQNPDRSSRTPTVNSNSRTRQPSQTPRYNTPSVPSRGSGSAVKPPSNPSRPSGSSADKPSPPTKVKSGGTQKASPQKGSSGSRSGGSQGSDTKKSGSERSGAKGRG